MELAQHSCMEASEAVRPPPSKRWTQFYAALQLAIQRAAHKWTSVFALFLYSPYSQPISSYKDFSECFPLWCEEQPNGAEGVFNTVSTFIETHIVVRFPLLSATHILLTNIDIGGGNTRTTQINCLSNMTSRKTWISYTKW